jgi:hypothetical protein
MWRERLSHVKVYLFSCALGFLLFSFCCC